MSSQCQVISHLDVMTYYLAQPMHQIHYNIYFMARNTTASEIFKSRS